MTSLRVALLAGARFPLREPFAGGLEAQTWLLAHALGRRGAEVTVHTVAGTDDELRQRHYPTAPVLSAAARQDVSLGPAGALGDHHAFLDAMLSLAESGDVDVIVNNTMHHLPIALARLVRPPVVTALHTPPTAWAEAAVALPLPPSARFVAVSAFTAAAWSPAVQASVVPNGIDLSRWRPGPGGKDAVWTGRLVPEKAPHRAIDVARAAGLHLRLAGPAHDRDYWDAEVAPRLGRHATYVGHLRQRELAELVGSSCVSLVTPVWDEPFGLVVLESLACGTPVAAWARGGIPEILDAGSGCTATASDDDALVEAVHAAAGLGRQACRRRAEEIGSDTAMADGYLRVCTGALGAFAEQGA